MKKILVIRLSSIGDVVLTAPILRAMRIEVGVEVHLLTKPHMGDLLHNGDAVDKFYTWGEPGLCEKLKAEKYDGILDLHKNWRSLNTLSQLLYFNANRAFHLDWPAASYDKKRFQRWLFVKTKSSRFHVSHVQERYLEAANELLRTLSEENPVGLSKWFSRENGKQQETQHKKLSMIALDDFRGGLPSYESLEELERLDAQGGTETVDLGLGDGYGVAILGGTYATKKIPQVVWEKVFLGDARKWVLIGGNDEKELASCLLQQFGDQLIDRVGVFDLPTSARCIAQSNMVVGGDTGFSHVAAAYGKPLLVIWGNTHPGLGFAAGKNNEKVLHLLPQNLSCHPCTKLGFDGCPKGHFRCMNDYSATEIKLLLQKLQAFS
jgi:ADP-heptose:LPS heptosyltransferase